MAVRAARLAAGELEPGLGAGRARRRRSTPTRRRCSSPIERDDGAIVGFCTAYLDLLSVRYGLRCWVEDLAVDPDRRSRGIGAALLAAAREWAAARGASHLELDSAEARVGRPPLLRARGRRDALASASAGTGSDGGVVSAATRSGFIGLAGRPNVGKSTLANALVGSKVAIVSDRPQTTRRAVRGVATAPDGSWQMVLVDLPGVQKPRDVLTERMQKRVERELADSDAVLFVLNGEQGIGPGDRFIAVDDRGGAAGGAGDLRGQQDRPAQAARAGRGPGRRRRARGRRRGVPDQRPPRDRDWRPCTSGSRS